MCTVIVSQMHFYIYTNVITRIDLQGLSVSSFNKYLGTDQHSDLGSNIYHILTCGPKIYYILYGN